MNNPHGIQAALEQLGIKPVNAGACTGTQWIETKGEILTSVSPVDGRPIADIRQCTREEYNELVSKARDAF